MKTTEENQQIIKKRNFTLGDYMKFLLPSLVGILLLMFPFKYNGETTILVALLADLATGLFAASLPGAIVFFIGLTAFRTIFYKLFRPTFIKNNKFLESVFNVSLSWVIIRIVGFILALMTLFQLGPEMIWSDNTGSLILFDLLTSLFTMFFFAGFLLPFLTDFGLLEFVGVLLTPIMRPLFKLPGRSSVDCVASWVGDGTIGVTLTNGQYVQGYYTSREASVISTTFSAVSITFCLIVLRQVDLSHLFAPYYLTILLVGFVSAIIMPRIPPLSRKPNTYYSHKNSNSSEDIPEGFTNLEWATQLAIEKAESFNGPFSFINSGFLTGLDMWLGVLPVIMAFGGIAVIIAEYSNFFQILGMPFYPIFKAFNVPEALEASQTVMIGFSDMFLPSVLASSLQSEMTKFIIATLSITQLVYLSEAGAVILGSEIPISILDMFLIFIERTLISLPIIIIIAKLIF